MKVLLIMIPLSLSLAWTAASHAQGGFIGPGGASLVTVAEARELPDDSNVILEGYLVRVLDDDEEYEFRDDTGTIVVEIDDDDWNGVEATPEDRIQILGEIDRDDGKVEFDADRIQVLR
ncbi:MAG: NirD/YgiW/YdeI family stress tolerance protein [Pseudomonadales bacterium]